MSFRNLGNPNQTSINYINNFGVPQVPLSENEVSRIVGMPVQAGEKIKGESRITYMPYQKKVTEYQQRQYVERVPVKRKVIEYEQRKIVEEVPREVVMTDYYAVENIKQYYKEVVPEKKVEMVPVERKVRRVQYVPVEKQIVHYPNGQEHEQAKGQSRIVLQKQGVTVRPDAVYRPLDPKLLYNYSSTEYRNNPVGYVEDGYKRYLSNAPTVVRNEGYYTGPTQTYYTSQVRGLSPRENITSYRTSQDINIYPN